MAAKEPLKNKPVYSHNKTERVESELPVGDAHPVFISAWLAIQQRDRDDVLHAREPAQTSVAPLWNTWCNIIIILNPST